MGEPGLLHPALVYDSAIIPAMQSQKTTYIYGLSYSSQNTIKYMVSVWTPKPPFEVVGTGAIIAVL